MSLLGFFCFAAVRSAKTSNLLRAFIKNYVVLKSIGSSANNPSIREKSLIYGWGLSSLLIFSSDTVKLLSCLSTSVFNPRSLYKWSIRNLAKVRGSLPTYISRRSWLHLLAQSISNNLMITASYIGDCWVFRFWISPMINFWPGLASRTLF